MVSSQVGITESVVAIRDKPQRADSCEKDSVASDVVPFTQARANLSELADQVKAGAEKVITKNGESYVALIDSDRLDYYHSLERERIHLLLIDDVKRGLADIAAGRTQEADAALAQLQQRRKAAT
jgi:prevent-host-death family protein